MGTVTTVILVIAGVYEVVARAVPTVKNWSILGNIVNILKIISDYLNSTIK